MRLSEIFTRLGDPTPATEADGWVLVCPSHNDHEPSLRVTLGLEGQLVLKCRAGCHYQDILAVLGVSSFRELEPVVNDMGDSFAPLDDSGEPCGAADQAQLAAYLFEAGLAREDVAMDYAARRFGVDHHQAMELGLGYDDGSLEYDRVGRLYHQVPRLVVPFRDFDGVPRGFQSRALEDSKQRWLGPSNPESGTWSRFAWFESSSDNEAVLICEGPGDALAAYAAGFSAVGIRGASMAPKVVPTLIERLQGRLIVLCGDADDAGRSFNASLAVPLQAAGFMVLELQYPDDVKDLAHWFESSLSFTGDFQRAVAAAPAVSGRAAAKQATNAEAENLARLNTDFGLALYLIESFDGDLVHSPGLGFFMFEHGVWKRDEMGRIRVWAHEAADVLEREALDTFEADLAKLEREASRDESPMAYEALEKARGIRLRAVMRLRTTSTLTAVLLELAAEVNVETDVFDSHPELLCVKNGTIELRTGTLRPSAREDMLTKKVDVRFDAAAQAPRWRQFLAEIMPEDTAEMVSFLQRLAGYGVTGSTAEQIFVIMHGRGANGKSVYTDVMSRVFKAITETTNADTFEKKLAGGIPNDVAALRGARLVMASESSSASSFDESLIKRMTGSDQVSARFMRQEFFTFTPTALIQIATNHKPAFKGVDEGLWRRIVLIPFSRYFAPAERDAGLTAELLDEAEGVLAWAVAGAALWYADGLRVPALVADATNDYRETSDEFAGFYPGVLGKAKGESLKTVDVYRSYVEWCDEEDNEYRLGKKNFFEAMEARGVFRYKGRGNVLMLRHVALGTEVSEEIAAPVQVADGSIFGGAR